MDQLIGLLIALIIFAIIAYGLWLVCTKFQLPPPVLWLCGAVLLIIILLWAAHTFAGYSLSLPHAR